MIQLPISGATSKNNKAPLKGDKILSVINASTLKNCTIREHLKDQKIDHLDAQEIMDIAERYRDYKIIEGVYDYTDMLVMARNAELDLPELEYLFVDEAQDLSSLQWILVNRLAGSTKNIVIAGDDKQAINSFNGADVDTFLNLPGKVEVLQQSYRVPKSVYNLANRIMKKMTKYRQEGSEWETP